MKIESIKKEGMTEVYLVSEAKPGFMNSLRRSIISEVPVLAIEDVFVSKNNSSLYDEILSHRLGLIPLTTPSTYNLSQECKCKGKGCARCSVKLTLKAKGPKIVYASEIKSLDPGAKPVYGDTPIVLLNEKQEIELQATAFLGKGKEHAKWSGGLCYHQYYPKIKIDSSKIKNPKECIDLCPKKLLILKNDKVELDKDRITDCDLCSACEECGEAIKVEGDETKFIFTIESWGQIPPREMLSKAISSVVSNLEVIEKAL